MRETKTTNPQLIELIHVLRKTSKEQDAPIWLDVADYLAKTRSNRVAVNLSNINRNTESSDVVIVPGKILASGTLDHSITVAAFEASTAAKAKLKTSKSTYIPISELLVKNPKGSKVKIIR
ncbi:MAG: 50S ribosomal protein L18e [Nitrososphaerota archaeon]|jgi:large subunit ribosomal protein L18e|nr:50S ribosomal protein L18e [Nitrososphaerota archaeon]